MTRHHLIQADRNQRSRACLPLLRLMSSGKFPENNPFGIVAGDCTVGSCLNDSEQQSLEITALVVSQVGGMIRPGAEVIQNLS